MRASHWRTSMAGSSGCDKKSTRVRAEFLPSSQMRVCVEANVDPGPTHHSQQCQVPSVLSNTTGLGCKGIHQSRRKRHGRVCSSGIEWQRLFMSFQCWLRNCLHQISLKPCPWGIFLNIHSVWCHPWAGNLELIKPWRTSQ